MKPLWLVTKADVFFNSYGVSHGSESMAEKAVVPLAVYAPYNLSWACGFTNNCEAKEPDCHVTSRESVFALEGVIFGIYLGWRDVWLWKAKMSAGLVGLRVGKNIHAIQFSVHYHDPAFMPLWYGVSAEASSDMTFPGKSWGLITVTSSETLNIVYTQWSCRSYTLFTTVLGS